jgi:hypothetical protein
LCSLVFHQHFRGACTGTISETSINFYQTTWHNNPEDSHPQLPIIYHLKILHSCSNSNVHVPTKFTKELNFTSGTTEFNKTGKELAMATATEAWGDTPLLPALHHQT